MHDSSDPSRRPTEPGKTRTARSLRSKTDPVDAGYEGLPSRCLLASWISWNSVAGTLTITGDSGANTASINYVNDGIVEISADGATPIQLWDSAITFIYYLGGDGDDWFESFSAAPVDARGHGGNDTLIGGSGNDLLLGGYGDDVLVGAGGNDNLSGGDQNDTLYGDQGDDTLDGGNGNDTLFGGLGDDVLSGSWDNDILHGEEGSDRLYGFTGVDWLYGGPDRDFCYGQAGDDFVLGGDGNDNVRGNNGDDQVYGEAGDDWIMGDVGNDLLDGGSGMDTVWAWSGNDTLIGGDDNDGLYGQEGDDQIYGGNGSDVLSGESGQDVLWGGIGNDWLYGGDGNDLLRGEVGADVLRGDAGNDSLFGGDASVADTLYGGSGADRFLTQTPDAMMDCAGEDAEVRFLNRTGTWTDAEIGVMDQGLARLHAVNSNTRLLKDSLPSGPLQFFKYDTLSGAAGVNWLQTSSQSTWQNGQWVTTYTYNREIRIAEWNEGNAWWNSEMASVAVHEIGHNWDSEAERANAYASLAGTVQQFHNISGWTNSNPGSSSYSQSGDGNWWHLTSAPFFDSYGMTNPYEDMATTWELYFDPAASGSDRALMSAKLAHLDSLFAVMA